MDESKVLLLVKNQDKTANVVSYEMSDYSIYIEFEGKDKAYPYNIENVIIKTNPQIINLEGKVLYYKNIPLFGVKQALKFNGIVKAFFCEGYNRIYDYELLKIEDNCMDTKASQDIIEYWTEISQYTNTENETEAFLKKQYDKLTFVCSSSVLGRYINKKPLVKLEISTEDRIFPFRFNLSQKQALDNALKSNISVIEGPPGTGKTQTILNIIANLAIMQNKTVAVVSSNNSAVQNVIDKLKKGGFDFFIAALGNNKNKNHFFENLPQFDVAAWKSEADIETLKAKLRDMNARIDYLLDLNNQKAVIERRLAAYQLEQHHFEIYFDNMDLKKIKKLKFYRKSPDKIISFLAENYIAKENGKSDGFIFKLKILLKYGFASFKNLKQNEINVILNLQKDYYNLKIESLENIRNNLQIVLADKSFNDMLNEHQEISNELFKNKLYEKYHENKEYDFSIRSYKANFEKFLEAFPVILSTTHSLRNCIPENFLFDYLIIDESSQVDLLTGGLALSCCKNAIIVGDTKQLPQIVNKDLFKKIKPFEIEEQYDYFKNNILSSMISLYGDKLPKVMLKEHYRCHPKIIEFCNQKYYNSELIPFKQGNEDDVPLILYRTSDGTHLREVTNGDKKGKFNQRELDVIVEEILKNPNIYDESNLDIGFTTPYRKQADKAEDMLSSEIECDTIHKYQGREKSIMIMSTVLDDSRAGKQGVSFVDNPCMINVAVSRAIDKFILVTHKSLFSKAGKEVGDLIRYMEYNTLDENIINSEVVSVFDLLYKEYSDKLIGFKNKIKNNSKYQSENIMYCLLKEVLDLEKYDNLDFTTQVLLKNLLNSVDKLNEREIKYVNHNSSIDFIVFHKLNKKPVLAIEVDGFAFHENNPKQLEKDKLKDNILIKYELPLLRLPTTGSNEEAKIQNKLDEIINKNNF